jgi:hypothetical protein
MVKDYLGLHSFKPSKWVAFSLVWLQIVHAHLGRRNAMVMLVMIFSWELIQRNARVLKK